MCVSGFNNQVSGKGIDRIKNSTSFMERYIKEMKVHRRPGGDYVSFYEDFEIFILQLLATIHVMVTIECGPRFESCDGQVNCCFFLLTLLFTFITIKYENI